MGKFEIGLTLSFFVGVFTMMVFTILLPDGNVVVSHKKLTPEWKLETDGKTIDTIYIYKNK
jgi:hypothetical protein